MRTTNLAPLFRPTIGFDRPFHLAGDRSSPPSQRRRQGLRWISAVHRRRHDDDDDPPPAPAAMRLAAPAREELQRAPGAAMLLAA